MFYNATIYGVWRYCLITWGGNVNKADKERIDGIIERRVESLVNLKQQLTQYMIVCCKAN